MKKIIIGLSIIATSVFAEIQWAPSYEGALS